MGLMTRTEVIAELVVGAILVVSTLGASGQGSLKVTEGTHQRTRAVPASTAPLTPEQMPPEPPKVTCDGDKLTIVAQNSTLASVLDAVRACTGAEIVVSEDAAGERLFAESGPGSVRAVLTDLLSSTEFNYVIQASPVDQQTVQTVLLSPREHDSSTELASNGNASTNWREWLETQQNGSSQGLDAALRPPVKPASGPATSSAVEYAQANPASATSYATQFAAGEIALPTARFSNPQSQGKSTQQLISDMLRLFDERKQMLQQQATLTVEEPAYVVISHDRVQD